MAVKVNVENVESNVSSKIKRNSHVPPGSWLARTLLNFWYLLWGMMIVSKRFILVKEMLWRKKTYSPEDEIRYPGEVVVITGGPRGIAFELLKKFLQLDFIIIMGARDPVASDRRIEAMRKGGIVSGKVHVFELNLKSLSSTKQFAENVLQTTNRIDFLLNNAGIMMTPFECTEDGFESQFQVNYLSHFLLTKLLLPVIKGTSVGRGSSCRIVNTSSDYHYSGSLNFNNLETRSVYSNSKVYYDAKLCQVLFSKMLERKLQEEKVNVHSYAVHPGVIITELWDTVGCVFKCLSSTLKSLLPTAEGGADVIMKATLSTDLETKGGSYLQRFNIAEPHSQANNEKIQELLWRRSEELTKEFF